MKREVLMLWMIIAVIFTMLIMGGCSAERKAANKINRARKLIEKARILDPESVRADTVYKDIIVNVPEVRHDTSFIDVGDTIMITKDRLKIQYVRDTVTNKVFIEAECKADAIIKRVPVRVEPVAIYKQSFWKTGLGIIIKVVAVIILVLVVMKFVFKII